MPGRSGSLPSVSFSSIDSSLSSLKMCQDYINAGMDIATSVALDLTETGGDLEDVNSMERVMLDYAGLDRRLNHFIQAVEEVTNQVKHDRPEKMPDLKSMVNEKFTALQNTNTDSRLQAHEKFMQFKEQLKELRKQVGLELQKETDQTVEEELDEDIAVTQSQTNFTCPITQEEMKTPVKNKVCGHVYEQEAIIRMIKAKQQNKKKARCPQVGCANVDVKTPDLVLDAALKRAIERHHRQKQ
ncbi:E3 SUMO-protein ligase NSE2 [Latimeria chalumnae]|uniref:E3 SUMO-protein ligase NSE2 n=1 Tax=Latimeria chalumnae TaxID=7897 RepID=UPI00313D1780